MLRGREARAREPLRRLFQLKRLASRGGDRAVVRGKLVPPGALSPARFRPSGPEVGDFLLSPRRRARSALSFLQTRSGDGPRDSRGRRRGRKIFPRRPSELPDFGGGFLALWKFPSSPATV